MAGRIYICGGETGTGNTRGSDCPSEIHDWPTPSGYVDASGEAEWRLRNGWSNLRCTACGLYGWRPGKVTENHHRFPAGDQTDSGQPIPLSPEATVCPECKAGKHPNCTGESWCDRTDQPTECACALNGHGPTRPKETP